MTVYFSLAISDSMFPAECALRRQAISVEKAREYVASGVVSLCNPSHAATLVALRERFGIDVTVPPAPAKADLSVGDLLIIASMRGLPRLTDRHEYTLTEIDEATFAFGLYTVIG